MVQYVRRLLLKIVPSLVTIPTPILFADFLADANVLFFLGGFAAVVADIFLRFFFYDVFKRHMKKSKKEKQMKKKRSIFPKKILPLSDHRTRARKRTLRCYRRRLRRHDHCHRVRYRQRQRQKNTRKEE